MEVKEWGPASFERLLPSPLEETYGRIKKKD